MHHTTEAEVLFGWCICLKDGNANNNSSNNNNNNNHTVFFLVSFGPGRPGRQQFDPSAFVASTRSLVPLERLRDDLQEHLADRKQVCAPLNARKKVHALVRFEIR